MELVELNNSSNAVVEISGLSTEQRKRLTIAVGIVANSSVISMDEPISGHDERTVIPGVPKIREKQIPAELQKNKLEAALI
ncbi:hypothetical protein LWI28_000990 [Acer negundo]|uniref:ABC transporter domain-containing protein n=1 Tax=Acer negundo TaxID=4023 RepID=A0AAD5ICA6_ACENE|nr:hypothetical protein LWI28_000990 [Acer negundo]